MPWTQADVDELKRAIASGVQIVAFSDKTVRYQTTQDMIRALAAIEAELAGTAPDASGSRTTLAATSRD